MNTSFNIAARPLFYVFCAAWLMALPIGASAQYITPASNLVIENIPPISIELVKKVEAYTEFKASSIVAWHPKDGSVLIRSRLANTQQLQIVKSPGAKPEPLTDFPDAVSGATFQPKKGEYLLFEKATDGDEIFRIYRLDLAGHSVGIGSGKNMSHAITAISPVGERASAPAWNRQGDRVVFTTVTVDKNNPATRVAGEDSAARVATTKLYVVDPLKPESAKIITTFEGGRVSNVRFVRNDKALAYLEYISAAESHLWTMDIASGKKHRLTPEPKAGDTPVAYSSARFSRDGKGFYTTSDRGSEFRHLVYIDLVTGKEAVLTAHLPHDVSDFAISSMANRIAFTTNEDGSSVLRFLDLASGKELPRPALLAGEISGLRWKSGGNEEDGAVESTTEKIVVEKSAINIENKPATEIKTQSELAFNLASARSPGEVYTFNLDTIKMTRWTNGAMPGINPLDFVDPKLIRWKSFDGLMISGFLYQPDAKKFTGKRPVIINIHGGPESQAHPGFIARNNYMVNEMGLAIIYPNVRGSSGFGKTFLAMDNGMKREDSVKDIGALLEWIKSQPEFDADKILVMGGSYGGYMSLAVATHYADKIAASIDTVGISDFVTFLTNTESYRRDLRRAEYGDERNPEMRKFLETISPLTNAHKIMKPLFVVQGRNDPRVPYTEALQIVEKVKKQNVPVWFLMAIDEGHGFAKKSNQDFLFYAQIKFMEQMLLN